jgi:hypothetical protein
VNYNRKTKKMKPVTFTEVQIGSVNLFDDDLDTYDVVPVAVSGAGLLPCKAHCLAMLPAPAAAAAAAMCCAES